MFLPCIFHNAEKGYVVIRQSMCFMLVALQNFEPFTFFLLGHPCRAYNNCGSISS